MLNGDNLRGQTSEPRRWLSTSGWRCVTRGRWGWPLYGLYGLVLVEPRTVILDQDPDEVEGC